MWPFKKGTAEKGTAAETASKPASPQTRKGDGTVLGDLILKGVYSPNAGMEKVGHFDPALSPFRTFTNGKVGLTSGSMADQLLEMMSDPAVASSMMMMGMSQSGDPAVEMGKKLLVRSTAKVLEAVQAVANDDAVGKYLIVTTTMPFHLTHWTGQRVVVAEVEHELKLNALANLLLNDPEFSTVLGQFAFNQKASALWDSRAEEVERMKRWAVERM